MSTKGNSLERLRVASPCPTDWESMAGDERTRYCAECKRYVYDFSKMTAIEAQALVSTLQGKLCARITRRGDGTVVTRQPLPVLPVAGRRASPLASVVVTAMISASVSASSGPHMAPTRALSVATELDGQDRAKDRRPTGETGSVVGTLTNPYGAAIPNASVALVSDGEGANRLTLSSESGEFRFASVRPGAYTLQAVVPGLQSPATPGPVEVVPGQELRIDLAMQPVEMITVSGVTAVPVRPLRSLYNETELIIVGRVGASTEVQKEGDASLMRTALRIKSTLKGEPRKPVVYVYHYVYGELRGPFTSGDDVLVFLRPRKPEAGRKPTGGYEVDDATYGVKKLPEADLSVYVDRIRELADISREEPPNREALVEWLIRCAEEPATRWEGASELLWSVEQYDNREASTGQGEEAESRKPIDAERTSANPIDQPAEIDPSDEGDEGLPNFAALLTAAQKERLMTALFNTETLADRDRELMDLAALWEDPRLVSFLLAQLSSVQNDPPILAERMMAIIAHAYGDEAVSALAEEYANNASYAGEDEDEEGDATMGGSTVAEESHDRKKEAEAAKAARSEILKRFLQAVQSLLNNAASASP
ncbi:MAG TPA: carboxypeptidase-like regulatory domain-containing protein [Blastocatellia bacterium]|nr:carboxypeptidase-like regulatory domain-containing protein [Blastocatellia bacterium]